MAKSEGQKLKLLYILKWLSERTDEEHAMSGQEIIAALEKEGINAERKSNTVSTNGRKSKILPPDFGAVFFLTAGLLLICFFSVSFGFFSRF